MALYKVILEAEKQAAAAAEAEGMWILISAGCLLGIRKTNRTLMEQDGGSGDEPEDEEVDGPPAKRSCTEAGKVILDSEEERISEQKARRRRMDQP